MSKNFNDYQRMAKTTAKYPGSGLGGGSIRYTTQAAGLTYTALGLAGEAGEVANTVKKIMRDDNGVLSEDRREQIAAELGDVLWYLAMVAEELYEDLEQIAGRNLEKLADRSDRNVIGGDGDTR